MAIAALQDVYVSFGPAVVLEDLRWEIQRGEKVGLVGSNGSGKTTIFRLLMGEMQPQIGRVTRARGLQIAYLPQDPQLDSSNTVLEEANRSFENVQRLEQRLAEVGHLIAEHHDTEQGQELMAEYDELHHRLEAAGGYRYETLVKEVLGGLGFHPSQYDLSINVLSGGQKCRIALAKLLLQEADLLLLDEPTNHLDIQATRFLEKFLADYHGAAVIVSHDRYLLDRVAEKIADLDHKKINVYPTNYSDYAEAKRIRELTAQREFEKQQEWIRHQREYAERVKADKSRAKQARGRLRYLDRMEKQGKVLDQPQGKKRRMALDLSSASRGGEMVLRCEHMNKAYDDLVLFDDFNLEIRRGQKIGIIGPNGVGKTTLLKMAMGKEEPDSGRIRLFENLQVGYYDQELSGLNTAHSVIEEIELNHSGPMEGTIRSFLARFLFTGEEVFKIVGDLSGGEQSRVALAKLVWRNPQVLILDEPTNHLDIPGKEVLEEALINYEGAILLVSHDRYFLDRVVNELLVLPEPGRYEVLEGNWSTYEEKLACEEAARKAAAEQAKTDARKARRKQTRQKSATSTHPEDESPYVRWSTNRLEETIIEKEGQLDEIEQQFANPEVYRDAEQAKTLRERADTLREELSQLNRAWEARAAQSE